MSSPQTQIFDDEEEEEEEEEEGNHDEEEDVDDITNRTNRLIRANKFIIHSGRDGTGSSRDGTSSSRGNISSSRDGPSSSRGGLSSSRGSTGLSRGGTGLSRSDIGLSRADTYLSRGGNPLHGNNLINVENLIRAKSNRRDRARKKVKIPIHARRSMKNMRESTQYKPMSIHGIRSGIITNTL